MGLKEDFEAAAEEAKTLPKASNDEMLKLYGAAGRVPDSAVRPLSPPSPPRPARRPVQAGEPGRQHDECAAVASTARQLLHRSPLAAATQRAPAFWT
jgi:hypothetical protein